MNDKDFSKKNRSKQRTRGQSWLSNRFLRHRYDDPEAEAEARLARSSQTAVEVDHCWDPFNPLFVDARLDEFLFSMEADSDDIRRYHLNEFLSELVDRPTLGFPHGLEFAAADSSPPAAVDHPLDGQPPADRHIEEGLAAFLQDLLGKGLDWNDQWDVPLDDLRVRVLEAIGDLQNVEIIKRATEPFDSPQLAKRICLFSPFWIRSPQTWDEDGPTPLLDHVLFHYEIPGALYAEWLRKPDADRLKWLCWSILLGQGGSLKRAADLFDWRISRRFQGHFLAAPSGVSPIEACTFAEVCRLGGTDVDFHRIVAHPAFVIDPTQPPGDESHSIFWRETAQWLIVHRDELTDDEADRILTWAMHRYTEARRFDTQRFSWKGRGVRRSVLQSTEYCRSVELPWSDLKWNKHDWDWELEEGPGISWSFVELTSGEELFVEGQAMNHCVSSYTSRCATGLSAIVSLRTNNARRVTIEVEPEAGRLVQARGQFNREINPEERQAIRRWAEAVVAKQR